MKILGIETSCDETAAAVIEGDGDNFKVLSSVISSQINIHAKYGGVVPEVAAREHVLHILPVINEALEKANIDTSKIQKVPSSGVVPEGRGGLGAIAVTAGPGLITSLMTGVETAKTLCYAWNTPLVGVNHIEGHIYANFIGASAKSQKTNPKQFKNSKTQIQNISFPALILTVSGGHTSLVIMRGHGRYEVIGETRDDAAGEAFDKAAQLMDLGYPGGPAIAEEALKLDIRNSPLGITMPRPMLNKDNFEFSFSGLKTSLFYKLKKDKDWQTRKSEYAFAFEEAVVDVLITKTIKAAKKYRVKTVMLSGGVSANIKLRTEMQTRLKDKLPDVSVIMPDLKYTTDNAVMIATAGYYKARRKEFTPWNKLIVGCNLKLS